MEGAIARTAGDQIAQEEPNMGQRVHGCKLGRLEPAVERGDARPSQRARRLAAH